MEVKIRKAKISDTKQIHSLIKFYAEKGDMLARPLSLIYENIRDFWVATEEGLPIGCCALHVVWGDLAEIKSLAVHESFMRQGIGTKLVQSCLKEAVEMEMKKVFALTYKPHYFEKLGFEKVSKEILPHKIWSECINCPKFPDCDEIAVLKNL
ncbi:MAG: N-acetyltransferase [Candidatus Aureabacteria bacterium]|nr:N-acetyltransferase [Candidatus Auribacterota bacterium]